MSVSGGTTYQGMYFLQTVDIDLNCFIVSQTSTFTTTRTTTGTSAAYAVGDTINETSTSGDWTYNDTLTVTKVTQTTVSILKKEFTYTMSVSRVATRPIVWRSIGGGSSNPFNGTYDGGGFTIANAYAPAASSYNGLFGYVKGATIKNLHVQYDPNVNVASYYTSFSCGGLIGTSACAPDSIGTTTISNVKVSGFTYIGTGTLVGGLIADGNANVDNVIIENICIKNTSTETTYNGGVIGRAMSIDNITNWDSSSILTNISVSGEISCMKGNSGGAVASMSGGRVQNVVSNVDFTSTSTSANYGASFGGVIDFCNNNSDITIQRCMYAGSVTLDGYSTGDLFGGLCASVIISSSFSGDSIIIEDNYVNFDLQYKGVYTSDNYARTISCLASVTANDTSTTKVANNLVQAYLSVSPQKTITIKGLGVNITLKDSTAHNIIQNNICLVDKYISLNQTMVSNYPIGYLSITSELTGDAENYTNNYVLDETSSDKHEPYLSLKMESEIKDRTQYNDWEDFDSHWVVNENINDGFPMLKCFLSSAKITGFDGSGTQADPYQIKTTADLQGMQAYYNDYEIIDEYHWKLMNDIDISLDANGLTINWCPIGYEGGVVSGFNGHFDGNGKTISGLTITEQYENVGLFGKLATNATITNLNVTGAINWDQAKYVGGVVGLIEDGATLTNCSFTGTITGYLNSNNFAVVGGIAGKYSADAITGIANYDCYVYGTDSYTTFNRYNSTYTLS